MNKDLKQINHIKQYIRSSKKIATLSFLTAVQVSSCISGRGQGFRDSSVLAESKCIDLLHLREGSPEFKKLQAKTANIVSEHLAKLHAQNAFFQVIEKCDLKSIQSLLGDPLNRLLLTSKEVVEGVRLALQHKDALSFRYKHKEIVHYLLSACNLSPDHLCAQDETGKTLLHLVIQRGDIDAAQFLVSQLPLKGLCAKDSKGRTPMHLAARCKGKKMFEVVFDQINKKSSPVQAIKELFKEDKNGYSVIESSYLPKDRGFAPLWNNSHIQLPTFYRKGSEMFKFILGTLPVSLTPDQLVTIAIGIEEISEGKTIYERYAATLRSIVKRYIEKEYGRDAGKIIRHVAHERNLPYIEQKYGRTSKEVQECRAGTNAFPLVSRGQYGGGSRVGEVDEGYVSG